jgi:hypothetical protein
MPKIRKSKPKNRGPKEERLVREDPEPAPARLLRARKLKAKFDEAHAAGLAALEDRDYARLDGAIQREHDVIHEQAVILADQADAIKEAITRKPKRPRR